MSALVAPLVAAGLGALAGEAVRRHVVSGGHRRDDDEGAPRAHRWLPVAAALLWAVVVRASWPGQTVWVLLVVAAVLPLLWLAAVDVEVQRLPDRVTLPLLAATPVAVTVLALAERDLALLGRALLAGLALGAFYAVLAMVGDGMGGGDVKLAPTLGMLLGALGWGHVLAGVMLTFVTASVFGLFLVLFRRAGRRTLFAFGPFMVGTTLVVLVLG